MGKRRHKSAKPTRPPHRYDLVTTRLHQVYFAMMPPSREAEIVADYKRFVADLRQARLDKRLTQEQLDERLGFTRGHIEKLENRTRIARADTLMLWAQGLDFDLALKPATRPE